MMLRLATMQDLTRIMAIVQATVMEMHAYGNYQWDEVYPTEQDFASDITQGDLFVSEAEGQICGLICINQTEPAVYADAGWTLAEKALVLHRMAVDPDLRGRGTGSELLQQAETLALDGCMAAHAPQPYGGYRHDPLCADRDRLFQRPAFQRL